MLKNKTQHKITTKREVGGGRGEIIIFDAVRGWWSCIYQEFKEILEENKQGIEGKSRTSTQFITFEEYTCMADKADKGLDARPSRSLFTALYIISMTRIISKRMNEHFGLCSQWKSRCLESLMQLDTTIDDVTATGNKIYNISAIAVTSSTVASRVAYESESCFCRAVRSTLPSP